jgi:biotin transport system substrate-specific component
LSALVETLARRQHRRRSIVFEAMVILIGSAVMIGSAQISIRLPFTPVPVTGQTLGVLLLGASLGPVRGALAVLAYLGEGAVGLPVFAEGRAGAELLVMPSPTGGYLWGFVLGALAIGFLAERRWDRGLGSAIGAMVVGEIAIFVVGVPWLAAAVDVSGQRALELGLYPFVLGELLKLLVAAGALPAAWRLVERRRPGL